MNSFKNPLIPLIENPVNVDRPIQELQVALAELGWLEKSFGRSYQSYRQDIPANKLIVYPEVWQGPGKDLLNCMPNDNLKSQSFFKMDDPSNFIDFQAGMYSRMRSTVHIIFWFNLKEIDKDADYRFIEILKAQAQRKIADCIFSSESAIVINRVWEEADNVFRGFTIDKVKQQELVHPWGGFRFECELTYREDCPTPEL